MAENGKRKRKLLTDPNKLWTTCQICQELGNLENMIRKQIPAKNLQGKELYQCFYYIYFCSEVCQVLF